MEFETKMSSEGSHMSKARLKQALFKSWNAKAFS